MERQREELSTKLRADLEGDDITGKLAGEPENTHQTIYERELKKHDELSGYIRN